MICSNAPSLAPAVLVWQDSIVPPETPRGPEHRAAGDRSATRTRGSSQHARRSCPPSVGSGAADRPDPRHRYPPTVTERPPATGWRAHTPNALTVARLVMTAAFIAVLAAAPTDTLALLSALLLFVVAGASDALDGYLARRWDVVSVFGRVADPLADVAPPTGDFNIDDVLTFLSAFATGCP